MADEEPKTEDQQPDAQQPAVTPPPASDSDLEYWKTASRRWEERSKANRDALTALKTEREKDLEQISSLQDELKQVAALQAANAELLREAVAAAKGVPAHRIVGETREELEADADRFLQELNMAPLRGVVPSSGTGGEQPVVSVMTGRERAREALGKPQG